MKHNNIMDIINSPPYIYYELLIDIIVFWNLDQYIEDLISFWFFLWVSDVANNSGSLRRNKEWPNCNQCMSHNLVDLPLQVEIRHWYGDKYGIVLYCMITVQNSTRECEAHGKQKIHTAIPIKIIYSRIHLTTCCSDGAVAVANHLLLPEL